MTRAQAALVQRINAVSWDTIIFFNDSVHDYVRWRVAEGVDGLFHWVWTQSLLNKGTTIPCDGAVSITIATQTYCHEAFMSDDWRIALPTCMRCMRRPYPG